MLEELNADVKVGRLALVVENFFNGANEKHHGIGFYFLMTLPETLTDINKVNRGLEHDHDAVRDKEVLELRFRWFHLDELGRCDVRPKCLSKALTNLSETTQHIVNLE